MPKNPINTETSRKEPRSGVPPAQASVVTKNQLGPVSSSLPEGDPSPVAIFIISELRVWTSSYVFDLSLSLSCSWFGMILMYHEPCYYSWILWCFAPLLSCNGLSFPFEVILSDWVFKDWEHWCISCMCLFVVTMRYSRDLHGVYFGDQLAGSVTLWTYA